MIQTVVKRDGRIVGSNEQNHGSNPQGNVHTDKGERASPH